MLKIISNIIVGDADRCPLQNGKPWM